MFSHIFHIYFTVSLHSLKQHCNSQIFLAFFASLLLLLLVLYAHFVATGIAVLRCVCAIFGSLTVWHWWEISFVECSRKCTCNWGYYITDSDGATGRLVSRTHVKRVSSFITKYNSRNSLVMSTRIEHKHKKKEILKCEFNAIINLISSTSSLSFLQRQRQRKWPKSIETKTRQRLRNYRKLIKNI